MRSLIGKLEQEHRLTEEEFAALLRGRTPELETLLREKADRVRRQHYGTSVYVRGLIEFTNFCKNNCYYCGIRAANPNVTRFRLTEEEILACCREGHGLGFRTFVLQGGEDPCWTPQKIEQLVRRVKEEFPDCAVTLSVGEQPREVYAAWRQAGADRYLLRHETADFDHYRRLHPAAMSPENRQRCLWDLKELGYQVGCGIMVGSPGQTPEHIAKDLLFMQQLQPHMVGIGPFLPQKDTPFGGEKSGTAEETVFLLSILRLLLPRVLLPATTALATLHPHGREMGILAGANVCMPNLSPAKARENYTLYDNKLHAGTESAQALELLKEQMAAIGFQVVCHRGDYIGG